jgi:hypothetical protein
MRVQRQLVPSRTSAGLGEFFAKAARSVLRHIRVGSKHELKQRIMEFIHDLNKAGAGAYRYCLPSQFTNQPTS